MRIVKSKEFANGRVHCAKLDDGSLIEMTDTFLPFYTKDAIGRKQNSLVSDDIGSRHDRWMVGVSTMSGCPVRCKFCATGNMKGWRKLTASEIFDQVVYVFRQNKIDLCTVKEFKINYTRMGEPFLNVDNVYKAIQMIDTWCYGGFGVKPHHYVSTIGIRGSDFSWLKGNITLQLSLHASTDERRRELIPMPNLMTIEELGQVRTGSYLKTTLNMTLVDEEDFDIEVLKRHFDPKYFFIKLSPINPNCVSDSNGMGVGVIEGVNLI